MTGLWTFHGGRLDAARAAYGDQGLPWIDLSTGINPHGWPGADLLAVDWRALPDVGELSDLEAAAARYFGVDRDHLCALPGTEIGLRLIGTMLPADGAHVAPSYRTHGDLFAPKIAADALPVADRSVILANPNNPDGRVTPRERLIGQLDRAEASGHWLIVDEAFVDATPGLSIAAMIADDRPLVIFRSFGKFFGLAGVRLGFVLAPRSIIARYRALLGSWPLSTAAIAIGRKAYRDAGWIAGMRQKLTQDAAALDHVLVARGFTPIGDCPLFRLVETDDARGLFERLGRRSILTRPFDYDPRWLRIGLPCGAEVLDRLSEALALG